MHLKAALVAVVAMATFTVSAPVNQLDIRKETNDLVASRSTVPVDSHHAKYDAKDLAERGSAVPVGNRYYGSYPEEDVAEKGAESKAHEKHATLG
ncbi:MAG: hypothetical protein Q9168_005565 [Polycauliona sp. 1 TL-2023]